MVQDSIAAALPEPQAGFLTGILLGDESGIAPELEEAFSRVGASHVVAISGFNMVIVSGIVLRVLSGLFRGHKTVVTLNALSVIAVYTLLVGASPGVVRAALMSGLLVIGNQLNRKTFVPTSLAFATLCSFLCSIPMCCSISAFSSVSWPCSGSACSPIRFPCAFADCWRRFLPNRQRDGPAQQFSMNR